MAKQLSGLAEAALGRIDTAGWASKLVTDSIVPLQGQLSGLAEAALGGHPWSDQGRREDLAYVVNQIASPVWEQVVFKALHDLDAAEVNCPEAATWWLNLPLQIRTWVVASVTWTCVLVVLACASLEHQAEAAILRDATGLDPAELAAAIACLAGMVYKHFGRKDDA